MSTAFTWRRKKKAEEVPDPTPLVADDGSWHEWESAGRRLMEEGDFVRAVDHLVQAVDRFDSNAGEMGRFLNRVSESALKLAKALAFKEKAFPAYLLANIDEEVRVKFPDMDVPCVLTDVFADACDSEISRCTGPGEVVMYATDALYACLGYVLHSVDVREDVLRCGRGSEICDTAAELVKGMKKGSGHTLPREASVFLDIYARYADSLKSALNQTTAEMSDSDLDQLAAYRANHPVDSVQYVFEGLDAANHTAVKGSASKRRYEEKWKENVRLFADQKVSFD